MRRVIGAGIALVFVLGGALYWRSHSKAPLVDPAEMPGGVASNPAAAIARRELPAPASLPPLAGLDLARIAVDDEGSTAPVAGRKTAHLTVEPELQRTAMALMQSHHLPEAAIVLVEVATGRVLAYASHLEAAASRDERRDLCSEATAPAASVFKIITGAALVESAGLGPDTKQCYSGGEQKLLPSDLEDDPARDRWCTTLTGAMGHSTNAVFARLALKTLKPATLEEMAEKFGFNEPVPFDGPTEASALHLPSDTLGYARTAAGFWNSTLSPIEAAYMSTLVARGGEATRLSIVESVTADGGATTYTAPAAPLATHRAIARDTAAALTTMMENTVREGTSYRAFHDRRGTSFLPGIVVAGKTGTLTDAQEQRFYTWFTGFAPARPIPNVRQVAVAVLVVNKPTWQVKANVVAREMLRAHFAREKVPNVSRPYTSSSPKSPAAIARRE